MKLVFLREAQRDFSTLLDMVERGEPVLIRRDANKIYILQAYRKENPSERKMD